MDATTRTQLYEQSLASIQPYWKLRGIIRVLLALGLDRKELEDEIVRFVLHLRESNREAAEEPVIDVYNDLVGWCSPHTRL